MTARPEWLDTTRKILEQSLIEGGEGPLPMVVIRRDGDVEAVLTCDEPRVLTDQLAPRAMAGFEGDEIVFLADTFYSNSTTNPEGKEWEHGEMQRRRREPAVAALLKEALVCLQATRSGEVSSTLAYYRRERGRVVWEDDKVPEGDQVELGGHMTEALKWTVSRPRMSELIEQMPQLGRELRADLGPERMFVHQKCATIRAVSDIAAELHARVAVSASFPREEWAKEIVHNSLGTEFDLQELEGQDSDLWWMR